MICYFQVGRRYSVPLSVNRTPVLPLMVIRRESLPILDQRRRFTLGPILHLEEEDEELPISVVSSSSNGGIPRSLEADFKRPVSAETLLPDLSIASMTNSAEATRLLGVLHGTSLAPPTARLTRQQTFPPLQPYVRVRYMSTTGELIASSSTSTSSSNSDRSRTGGEALKRDSSDDATSAETAVKMAKMAREKENVDPQLDLEMEIAILNLKKSMPQVR